jgi:hypothetical protein
MNYSQLFAEVKSYLQNDFPQSVFTDQTGNGALNVSSKEQIDTFITQAETRIYNSVQIPALRKSRTTSLVAFSPYIAAPDDFLSVYSFAIIVNVGTDEQPFKLTNFLLNKDVNYLRAAYPYEGLLGYPEFYAIFGPRVERGVEYDGLSFMFAPTPYDSYDVELHYYYYPESITVTADGTTWLGNNYSPVLLYGALVEGYTFMKGDADMINQYEKKYQEAMGQLKRLGDGLQRGDAYRNGQARVQVT